MDRPLTTAYWMEAGANKERERIISMIKNIEQKYPHKDYSPTEVIDLVNGVEFNKNNQITNTYKGWE